MDGILAPMIRPFRPSESSQAPQLVALFQKVVPDNLLTFALEQGVNWFSGRLLYVGLYSLMAMAGVPTDHLEGMLEEADVAEQAYNAWDHQ